MWDGELACCCQVPVPWQITAVRLAPLCFSMVLDIAPSRKKKYMPDL